MATFLKNLGDAAEAMSESDIPALYEQIGWSSRPRSLRVDDKVVLYSSGAEKILGIVEIFMPPQEGDGSTTLNWRADVRPRLTLEGYDSAPDLETINLPGGRDLRSSARRQPFLRLEDEEYRLAVDALRAAGATETGWKSL